MIGTELGVTLPWYEKCNKYLCHIWYNPYIIWKAHMAFIGSGNKSQWLIGYNDDIWLAAGFLSTFGEVLGWNCQGVCYVIFNIDIGIYILSYIVWLKKSYLHIPVLYILNSSPWNCHWHHRGLIIALHPIKYYLEQGWPNNTLLITLRPRQNGRRFAYDTFKCIFLNESVWIPINISLKFVPKCRINNIPALFLVMAWRRPGDKPLSEPMMVSLTTHICVTRPQWVISLRGALLLLML